jgi:hypothetical protein
MKRVGNLYESIADIDNLRLAFVKAKRGKEHKTDVFAYSKQVDKNLLILRQALLDQAYMPNEYHFFTIYEPKVRLICAASFADRVLHHAIMNVCHDYFEKFQIFDSYATRLGKGQFAALERAGSFTRRYLWFCKLDVRKYFDSVSHDVLLCLLSRRFKDQKLMELFRIILASYGTSPGNGLPIGNLTSQYFANFLLAHADHHLKEEIRLKPYVRYMDDMVLWGNDKEALINTRDRFSGFISEKLKLELKPACLNASRNGLPFLGFVLFPDAIRLNKQSKGRFFKKLKMYNTFLDNEWWSEKAYANHVGALFSFVKHGETHQLRTNHIKRSETGHGAPTA